MSPRILLMNAMVVALSDLSTMNFPASSGAHTSPAATIVNNSSNAMFGLNPF